MWRNGIQPFLEHVCECVNSRRETVLLKGSHAILLIRTTRLLLRRVLLEYRITNFKKKSRNPSFVCSADGE